MKRSRRVLIAIALVLVAGAVGVAWRGAGDESPRTTAPPATEGPASPARSTVAFGISGEDPSMFADPRFSQLGLHQARVQASWDLVTRLDPVAYPGLADERTRLETWLKAARAAGIREVLLAIKPSRDVRAEAPEPAVYADAIQRLLAWIDAQGAGDLITAVSAWNEPNLVASTRDDPARAAAYFVEIRALCAPRGCTPVAGDFADRTATPQYVDAYRAAIGPPEPAVWGWHAYEDAWARRSDPSLPRLRAFLAQTPSTSQVWLTEQGGIVRRGRPGTDGRMEQSPADANADLQFLLSRTTRLDPRITRFDVYQFRGEAPPRWDSGLIAPDGATRASFCTFRRASNPALTTPCT